MSEYPAGTITENGVDVPITVDDFGKWHASHGGRAFREDTRERLREKIRQITRRTTRKVAVPFTQVERLGVNGIKFWRGEATGIHAGNGNVLYTREVRGETIKDQFTSWGNSNNVTFGALPDSELSRYHQLVKEWAEADANLRRFETRFKVDLKDVVAKALDASE